MLGKKGIKWYAEKKECGTKYKCEAKVSLPCLSEALLDN